MISSLVTLTNLYHVPTLGQPHGDVRNGCSLSLGVVHKGRSQKTTHFLTPSPLSAFDQPPPLCGRPHLASYTV